MKRLVRNIVCVSIIAAFSACSTPQKVIMPDGSSRMQLNNSEAIVHDYEMEKAQAIANKQYEVMVNQNIVVLQEQILQLKAYIEDLKTAKSEKKNQPISATTGDMVIQIKASPVEATSVKRVAPSNSTDHHASNSTIEVQTNSVVFRIREGYAETNFEPSQKIKAQLLKLAQEADIINIRGRTDAEHFSEANKSIAINRAYNARTFLVENGITTNKIRIYYLSAGGFVADNSTEEGKAMNRRVELEINGLSTANINKDDLAKLALN